MRLFGILFLCFASIVAVESEAEPHIVFHNDIKINAHTFLIEVALGKKTLPESLKNNKETLAAIAAYTELVNVSRFHLLRSNNAIAEVTSMLINSGSLTEKNCPPLCITLSKFIPVYQARIWNSRRQQNKKWIKTSKKLLKKYGSEIELQLNRYFKVPLIPSLHNIYVIENMNKGATTSGRSPVSIMSSANSEYQNLNALEMIFHEVAHTYATSRTSVFRTTVNEVFGHSSLLPRDLWHVIHFYTVGYVVQQVLKEHGISYTTYADSYGIYSGRWEKSAELIEKYWLPYLAGKKTMKEVLVDMKNDLLIDS